MKWRFVVVVGVMVVTAVACGGGSNQSASPPLRSTSLPSGGPSSGSSEGGPRASVPPGTPQHIVLIVFENHEYGEIIGSGCCPYLNALASRGRLFVNSFAVAHPSLPNYLAMTGGSTFGRTSDDTAPQVDSENLFHQLQKAGVSWKAYQETMPSPCFKGDSAGSDPATYELHHDPAMMYADISADHGACRNVVPLTNLPGDLSSQRLPAFAFITPNDCNDMHSCDPSTGDKWLKRWMPRILSALKPNGVAILTFDEGSSDLHGGGHIATLLIGPRVKPGKIAATVTHYSLLAGLERALGLPALGKAKAAAPLLLASP